MNSSSVNTPFAIKGFTVASVIGSVLTISCSSVSLSRFRFSRSFIAHIQARIGGRGLILLYLLRTKYKFELIPMVYKAFPQLPKYFAGAAKSGANSRLIRASVRVSPDRWRCPICLMIFRLVHRFKNRSSVLSARFSIAGLPKIRGGCRIEILYRH